MNLANALESQPRSRLYLEAVAFVLLVGYIDYVTPLDFSLYLFYLAPVLFLAWAVGTKPAICLAIFSTFVWWLALGHSRPAKAQFLVWRVVSRTTSLSVIALGGGAMRQQREVMRARVSEMERTRQLEEAIVRISEREQMRIGQDLHDGICQHLAAVDCAVECLRHDLEEKDLPEAAAAAAIQTQINRTMSEARDLARGIFPVQLQEEGFLAALQELVATMNRLHRLPVTLNVHGDIRIPDPQVGMHLYRIAQEALSNASKHANAREVKIDLRNEAGAIELTVSDDGVGLKKNGHVPAGMGLQTMQYRSRSLGGEIAFEDNPGGGLRVHFAVRHPAEPTPASHASS
jgi:signal transduction histidine kinase